MKYLLKPYEDCPYQVSALFQVLNNSATIEFQISDLNDILLAPKSKSPQFVEGLWEKTCFEFFYDNPKIPGTYTEWNFSPGGDWCCYEFEKYRSTPKKITQQAPKILLTKNGITATINLNGEFNFFNLTTILKSKDKNTHFFALKHRLDKADFHFQEVWQKNI